MTTPIVEFPTVVRSSLPFFEDVFTKPQMRNFATYLTGLIVSPNHTISYMNNLFYGHRDQSALNNFITDSTWSDEKFDRSRYRLILNGLSRSKKAYGEGLLLLDDTLSHKTGKHMEYAGKFFDHSEGKYMLAHDILTTHLVKGKLSIPLDLEVYRKFDQLKEKQEFKTKNVMVRELIAKACLMGIPFSCVIGDSWFFNKENTQEIESFGKDWVFGCKSNRLVLMPNGWMNLSEWAKGIPKEKFVPVEVRYKTEKRTFWCCAKTVIMRNQGRVRVVVSYDNPELNGEPEFLCANRLDWNEFKVMKVYAKRWRIDSFYKDAKQNLGLEEYEMRKIKGVKRHLAMVFIADTLLEFSSAVEPRVGIQVAKGATCLDTIGLRCRIVCTELLTSFIQFVLKVAEKIPDPRQIVSMTMLSRTGLRTEFAKV